MKEEIPRTHSLDFETAAGQAFRNVPVVKPDQTAGDVRDSLVGAGFESVSHIAVCERGKFAGILRIEDLMNAPADARAADLMDREPPRVSPGVDQEIAAWKAARHGESALAVVDSRGVLQGIVPPHRLLSVLLAEHEEDLSHLGGFLQSSAPARGATEEPVRRRFRHRMPWLLAGLGGSFLAAGLVGGFEEELREHVILAFFLPAIVYLADAVGTQTETVVIRGLSLGIRMRAMLGREVVTGLAVGVVMAFLAYPLVFFIWGVPTIALAVGLSVFASCSTATLAAIGVPWLFTRLGMDPAFGSGPLATVLQDLLSIFIYFVIVAGVLS